MDRKSAKIVCILFYAIEIAAIIGSTIVSEKCLKHTESWGKSKKNTVSHQADTVMCDSTNA